MSEVERYDSIGRRINRVVTADEADKAARAIAAAKAAVRDNITIPEAAKRFDVKARSVHMAMRVVLNGTEEEVQSIKDGKTWLYHAYRAVMARTTKGQRLNHASLLGSETLQARRIDSTIYGQLRTALDAISNLPQPADVMAVVKKNKTREKAINQSLMTAFAWITEFSDAWTK